MSGLTSRIEEHIQHTEEVLERIDESDWNEETTKRLLIQPFLENVLQWPMGYLSNDGRISSEYPVQIASQTKHMDYVLLDNSNDVKCVVEMKKGSANLKEEQKKQICDYMKSVEAVWGILTNGTEFCFYIRDIQNSLNEEEISHITYSSLSNHVDLLQVYTFNSLISELSEEVREEILEQYKRKEEFDIEETKNTLYDVLEPRNDEEKELINKFVTDFSESIQKTRIVIESENNLSDVKQVIQEETNVIINSDDTVQIAESDIAAEQLHQSVKTLVENDFITQENIPYKIKESHTRFLLNSEPVHSDGEEMRNPKEINGIFIECNRSTENISKCIESLIQDF